MDQATTPNRARLCVALEHLLPAARRVAEVLLAGGPRALCLPVRTFAAPRGREPCNRGQAHQTAQ